MATDNTQVNNGSGDVIRDIDRGSAKTQVVQLDAGGQSAESLVSSANGLPVKVGNQDAQTGGLPVNDANLAGAQTTDAPLSVSIAGDANGDFAGVNILEKLVDDSGDLKMAVRVVNPPGKFDAQGAQIISDAVAPINLYGVSGQFIYIDTTGYQSLTVTTPFVGGLLGQATTSNDGITWSSLLGYSISAASNTPVTGLSTSGAYVFPVNAKFIRIAVTQAGFAVAYLRNIPAPNPAVIMPQNIAQVGGSSTLIAGPTGTLAVGGGALNGFTPTTAAGATNPLIVAGVDSGTPGVVPTGGGAKGAAVIRQLLTDNTGRLRLAEETPVQNNQNAPALGVQDVGQFEGQDQYELLAQILLELRINNQLMADLPQKLYSVFQALQNAPTTQNLYAGLSGSDEPAAYRSDPTIFNQ